MPRNKQKTAVAQKQPAQKHLQVSTQVATFSGPLPHPALLQKYEDIQPGFAERIVCMAEGESAHRRDQEKKELDADIRFNEKDFTERRIGQFLALTIVLIMAGLGCYLALNGKEITGSVFGGPAIVSIVGAFLKKNNHK